jgi:hypothetical protein
MDGWMAGWLDGWMGFLKEFSLLARSSYDILRRAASTSRHPYSLQSPFHASLISSSISSSSPPLLSSPLCCDPSLHIAFLVLNYRFTLSAGIRYLVVRPIDSLPPPSI